MIELLRFDAGLNLLGEITGCSLGAEGPEFEMSDVTRIYDDILLGAWFLEGLRFCEGSTVAVLTTGPPLIEFADKGLMITSLPLKVNAESRECNSVSGLTVLALTTIGKSTKNSSWTYGELTVKSRKACDFVWISARNLMTVRKVDADSARSLTEALSLAVGR